MIAGPRTLEHKVTRVPGCQQATEANGEKERTFVNLTNRNLIFGHFSCSVTFIGGLTHISIGSFVILLSKNMMEFSDHIGHL